MTAAGGEAKLKDEEEAKIKEEAKVAAKLEEKKEEQVAERRRILVTGDAEGSLLKLFGQVESQQKRGGAFDALFAVGGFLPVAGSETSRAAAAALAEYVSGKRKAPVDTYFIESRTSALLQASPEGKQLCDRVHFLGGFGVKEISGLRVAYLSGRYDAKVYGEKEASAAGEAFVGAAYTPQAVEGLINLAREGRDPVDLLLTAEWPRGLAEKLDDAALPADPDGVPLNWLEISSPAVAELVVALEPRYHFFGTGDIFYQRPPFQTLRSCHVCRCIGLGRVGSKGKGRLWMHGLSVAPVRSMPKEALMLRPPDTTPCPFAVRPALGQPGTGVKRDLDEEGGLGDDGGQVVPDQVFLSRLPSNIEDKRIESALRHVGKIVRVHLARDEREPGRPCKGYGWVTFSSPEEAQAACDLSGMLECGGREINICLAKAKAEGSAAKRKREIQIKIEPHTDCWFCLANPQVEKHMIVAASRDVYVATARGPVVSSHLLVLPVKHAPCFSSCPEDLQEALQAHVQALRRMFQESGMEVLVWERWIPMSVSAANHMQIQVVPVDVAAAGRARRVLVETVKDQLPKAKLRLLRSPAEIGDQQNDNCETPYIYFEVPGDLAAKGQRPVERYVYAGVDGEGPRIPINFGRQVACNLLGLESRVDWRSCTDDRDTEKGFAEALREQFKAFAPGRKK